MSSGTLLVCSPPVLERLRAMNGTTLPAWADIDRVTDEELKAAADIHLVFSGADGESDLRVALVRRAREQDKSNDHLRIQEIGQLEDRVVTRKKDSAAKQRKEDERAEMQERARRKATMKLDSEELAEARGPRLKRTARAYITVPRPTVVLDGVLAAELNLLGGPSESGKSLLARDWALAVASGKDWRGHPVPESRSVLWVASEGTSDFADRWIVQPLWEDAADRVYVLDEPISLVSEEDVTWLLSEYAAEQPGLVVFDVIYGAGLSDDTGVRDVLPAINAMKKISATWGAATLALGHSGHGEGRRFRGSSSWRQLAATEWHLADLTFSCEKSKVADKRRFGSRYAIEYPNLRWLSASETLADEAGRYLRIREDIADNPYETDTHRAARLAPEFGLRESRMRELIRIVKKSLMTEEDEATGE